MALTLEGLEKWYEQTYKMKCIFAGEDVPDPIPMPDVTTIDGLLEGIAEQSEEAFVTVADNLGFFHDYDNAYKLQLPADLKRWYGLKKVGGRTIVWNQINSGAGAATATSNGVTFTFNDDLSVDCTGAAYGGNASASRAYTGVAGHVYLFRGCPAGGGYSTKYVLRCTGSGSTYDTGSGAVFTEGTSGTRYVIARIANGCDAEGLVFKPQVFDLTVMFGAGNEPTLEAFNAMFPKDIYPYNAGELLSAGVTAIVSKDADDTVLETISVPAEVQALTGYGISCPDGTNYIDFETQKFYQYVGSRAYEAGDDSDSTVLTDGTTTHYKLDTPVETDISVSVDNLQCVSGGSLTFENQHNGDYNIPVPIEVQYIGV